MTRLDLFLFLLLAPIGNENKSNKNYKEKSHCDTEEKQTSFNKRHMKYEKRLLHHFKFQQI